MITLRPSEARGHVKIAWLDSRHSFSFGRYYDPQEMNWGALRVINEDWIEPDAGFNPHGHSDMEILTYVLQGALEHKDSTGGGSVLRPGEVQLMSAGRGITHSEFNPSLTERTHLLQIWVEPNRTGLEPGYQQHAIPGGLTPGGLKVLTSPDGRDGSLRMVQDAVIYAGSLEGEQQIEYPMNSQRRAYVHLARGAMTLNAQPMKTGDGAKIAGESLLTFSEGQGAEFLLFDLP
ncbi:MAG: pirin family protein [Pseudomonadota bacterium]